MRYDECKIINIARQAEVLHYSGDLNTPPDEALKKKKTNFVGKKTKMGRKGGADDSSDEDDW